MKGWVLVAEMITKEHIRQYLYELGMCAVGFTHAGPFERLERVLTKRRREGYTTGPVKGTIEGRCRPRLHFPWANTIISVAYPYRLYWGATEDNLKGNISSSALGEDYHCVLRERLELTANFISERVENLRYKIMADTGPLVDREVAYRAGVGWYGKNCSIIVPSAGTTVFLGEMLTDLVLEPDRALERDCGACTRCIDNCPTGALIAPYNLNAQRCISYLTQKRGIIPREMRNKIGNNLYGCDKCLISCPYNRDISYNGEGSNVDLWELMQMDRSEFDKRYKKSPWAWRGLNVLKRNAAIVLGNKGKRSGLDILEGALKQPSAMVRGHAAWAIGRIGGPRARELLRESSNHEQDEYVLGEINAALGEIKL